MTNVLKRSRIGIATGILVAMAKRGFGSITKITVLLGALLCVASLVKAQIATDANPATIPKDRLDEAWWAAQHRQIVDEARQRPSTQLLMIGDSITDNYRKAKPPDEDFQPTWQAFYAPRNALNLGFSGDTTSNVLWRLDHGEVSGLHPKAAVLLIGTNNTAWHGQTAEQVEGGIDAVVADLNRLLPQTRVLIVGILPSGISDAKSAVDKAVNTYLAAHYRHTSGVRFMDIQAIFYKDGLLNTAIFYDPRLPHPGAPLHPDTVGQRMMAEAIEPTLRKMMR